MDSLSIFPQELLLFIFSFLRAGHLNVMQQTCKKYRDLIKSNSVEFYSSRQLDLELHLRERKYDVFLKYNKYKVKLRFKGEKCTETRVEDIRKQMAHQKGALELRALRTLARNSFLNRSLGQCLGKVFKRSGGIRNLGLHGEKLTQSYLTLFIDQITCAQELELSCDFEDIPIEDLYRYILSPRRPLSINNSTPLDFYPPIDDRFCSETGAGKLEIIKFCGPTITLTEERLKTLINREDIHTLELFMVEGPASSCRCIRNTIQQLLHTSKSADVFFFGNTPFSETKEMLSRVLEDESIETVERKIETELSLCLVFTYKVGHRIVTAIMRIWDTTSVRVEC